MMLTFRAGKLAAFVVLLTALAACSREQQDWRSAEASDTVEGYGQFLQRHPDSELATEARTRVAQLSEDLEWQRAGTADSADAYKQFLAQHPNGKWAQEARIRIENYALGREGTTSTSGVSGAVAGGSPAAGSGAVAAAASGSGAAVTTASGSALGAASPGPAGGASGSAAGVASGPGVGSAMSPGFGSARALPGEAAQAYPGESARAQAAAQVSPARTSTSGASVSGLAAPGPPVPSPVPTSSSSAIATAWRSDDGFGVQLGAFASETAATSEWQQLTARFSAELHGLAPRVVSTTTATGRLFRLQALVFDEARARTICDMLKKQSQACVPVLPH